MKYILKNIKTFFQQEKGVFILCLLCIFFSMQVILVAYGVYGFYLNKKYSTYEQMKTLDIGFKKDEKSNVTKGMLVDSLKKCPEPLVDKIEMFYVEVEDQNISHFEFRFRMQDKKITTCEIFRDNLKKNGLSTTYFSKKQEENGEKVAIVNGGINSSIQKEVENIKINENEVEILGKCYEIIGTQGWNTVLIPFQSLADEVPLAESGLYISFYDVITKADYDELKDILIQEMGEYIQFPELEVPDFNQIYFYNTVLIINILVAIVASINFSLLYKFILMKRSRNLAICQITGLLKKNAACYYIGECVLLLIIMIPMSFGFFNFILLKGLRRIYAQIEIFYTVQTYAGFGIGYFAISICILSVVILHEIYSKSLLERL